MTQFVHIADEKDAAAIKRSGLALPKRGAVAKETDILKSGVFATPVTPNYLITHQWVRELKRRGFRVPVAVHFRVPSDEPVWAGRYNQPKALVPASQAAAILRKEEILGFEVVVPRSIQPNEIVAVRAVSQTVGWRHFPESHGRPPCACQFCQRGNIKGRRIRDKDEKDV